MDEGCKYFIGMSDSYCVILGMNRYTCILDHNDCEGYLEEALNTLNKS